MVTIGGAGDLGGGTAAIFAGIVRLGGLCAPVWCHKWWFIPAIASVGAILDLADARRHLGCLFSRPVAQKTK